MKLNYVIELTDEEALALALMAKSYFSPEGGNRELQRRIIRPLREVGNSLVQADPDLNKRQLDFWFKLQRPRFSVMSQPE